MFCCRGGDGDEKSRSGLDRQTSRQTSDAGQEQMKVEVDETCDVIRFVSHIGTSWLHDDEPAAMVMDQSSSMWTGGEADLQRQVDFERQATLSSKASKLTPSFE